MEIKEKIQKYIELKAREETLKRDISSLQSEIIPDMQEIKKEKGLKSVDVDGNTLTLSVKPVYQFKNTAEYEMLNQKKDSVKNQIEDYLAQETHTNLMAQNDEITKAIDAEESRQKHTKEATIIDEKPSLRLSVAKPQESEGEDE